MAVRAASGPRFGAASSTPIMLDRTVYLGDLLTSAHAAELAAGKRRWMVEEADGVFGPSGVAVGLSRVFADQGTDVAALPASIRLS